MVVRRGRAVAVVARLATLSIIIPSHNEGVRIQHCLSSLQALRPFGVDIILVDGGSTDNTCQLSAGLVDQLISTEPGRAHQMNCGAAQARGEWLLFLHCDTFLPDNIDQWREQLAAVKSDWGFFMLRLSGSHYLLRIIERAINIRSRLSSVATGDQCQFVRRTVFEMLQGFAAMPLMEDIELSKRLRRRSPPFIWHKPVLTSSRRWQQQGYLKTIAIMWCLRLAYFVGVSPQRLHRIYYGAPWP